MRTVEAEGSTVEEAIATALASLGVARDQAEIELLQEASAGGPGAGGSGVRVRATTPRSESPDPGRARADVSGEPGVSRETPAGTGRERLDKAREVLSRILRELTGGCSVHEASTAEPGTISLVIEGGEPGIVIGHHGQTLDAIEHLLNRIVFRDDGPASGRVSIDMEAYRRRRREQLEQQAVQLARKAQETGRSVAMNPMSARDRRTVHLALRDWPGVVTGSDGEGDDRHVVILPAAREA